MRLGDSPLSILCRRPSRPPPAPRSAGPGPRGPGRLLHVSNASLATRLAGSVYRQKNQCGIPPFFCLGGGVYRRLAVGQYAQSHGRDVAYRRLVGSHARPASVAAQESEFAAYT